MASLPLDVLLEIAARSDPVTLVRCAATCRAVRRRVADDDPTAFRRRLRLRHCDRFVPSLLRGHLMMAYQDRSFSKVELQFVDTTTADATARPVTADDGFLPPTDGETSRRQEHLASRDGLFLVRSSNYQRPYDPDLCVCHPATRRSQALPAEPTFDYEAAPTLWQPYVLLVGDGSESDDGVGRPFQVLKTNLALSRTRRFLQVHIFSSDTGTWGPYIEIQTPDDLHGSRLLRGGGKPVVVDGAVHWLCMTDKASYVLKLQIREAKVAVTALPATFPRPPAYPIKQTYHRIDYLLVTTSPCGSCLMVLVAGRRKISAWVQERRTVKWKENAQDVVENDDLPLDHTFGVRLRWFAERSGMVLISMNGYGFFWLDLRSMEIVRQYETWSMNSANNHPYEMHLSSWVPTFSVTL